MSTVKPRKSLPRLVLAVGAAAAFALTGCSAGQVTQTDTQVPAVPGTNGSYVDADKGIAIEVRDVVVAFKDEAGYAAGDDAPLVVRIFNNGKKADTLVGVSSTDAEEVVMSGADVPPAEPTDDATAGDDAATGDDAESAELSEEITVDGYLLLVPEEGPFLELRGLKKDLPPGGVVSVTFEFETAKPIELEIPVTPPAEPGEREVTEFPEGH